MAVLRVRPFPECRIETPQHMPISRIEREQAILRGGKIQHTIDEQRPALILGPGERVSGVILPRKLDFVDILAVNLPQARVLRRRLLCRRGKDQQHSAANEAHGDLKLRGYQITRQGR